MKKLYVIAGCNGAGKTTASYTILPDILECEDLSMQMKLLKGYLLSDQKKLEYKPVD